MEYLAAYRLIDREIKRRKVHTSYEALGVPGADESGQDAYIGGVDGPLFEDPLANIEGDVTLAVDVERALTQLTDRQRDIITMWINGADIQDIMKTYNYAYNGVVYNHTNKARAALRKLLFNNFQY